MLGELDSLHGRWEMHKDARLESHLMSPRQNTPLSGMNASLEWSQLLDCVTPATLRRTRCNGGDVALGQGRANKGQVHAHPATEACCTYL
jgi:hypothetical protein